MSKCNQSPLSLQAIAGALNGKIFGNKVRCAAPGHKALSVVIWPRDDGDISVHSHNGEFNSLDLRDEYRRKLGIKWTPGKRRERPSPRPTVKPEPDDGWRINQICDAYREAGGFCGTLAEGYLQARGLRPNILWQHLVRFHPRFGWWDDDARYVEIPCLLAPFENVITGELTACSVMRLDKPRLWPKIERKFHGRVTGAAIKDHNDILMTETL
jgi:hypothetical protein